MNRLDLSQILKVYAQKYTKELNLFIQKHLSIDGTPYKPLAHKRPKGHRQGLNTRLDDTGNFKKDAVICSSTDHSLILDGNSKYQNSRGHYIAFNNKDNIQARHIKPQNQPLIFPRHEVDFWRLGLSVEFKKDIEKTVYIQCGESMKDFSLEIPKTIKVGA